MNGAHQNGGRWALVTGASAGIGEAFARFLAAQGYSLVASARRVDRLEQLAETLSAAHQIEVQVRPCDLSDPGAVEALVESIGVDIDVLVNSAGYAIPDYFVDTDWPTLRAFLEVMAMVPIRLSHAFTPGMVNRGWGRIIHVSSLAAFVSESPGSLYGPTKTFMVGYARSQARELAGTGVHVTALCPGFTRSEFHDVLGNREEVDRMPRWMWGDVEPVVRAGWYAVQKGQEVCIPGLVNKGIHALFRMMPSLLERRLPHTKMPGRHEPDAKPSSSSVD